MDSLSDPRLKSRELSSEADCGHCPGCLVASVLQEFRKCLCQISLRLLRKFFTGLRTDLVRKEVDLQCNTQKLSPSARRQVVSSWAPHRSHGPVCDHSSSASAASYGSYGSKMRYQCTQKFGPSWAMVFVWLSLSLLLFSHWMSWVLFIVIIASPSSFWAVYGGM